jgi:hypothetical protein
MSAHMFWPQQGRGVKREGEKKRSGAVDCSREAQKQPQQGASHAAQIGC